MAQYAVIYKYTVTSVDKKTRRVVLRDGTRFENCEAGRRTDGRRPIDYARATAFTVQDVGKVMSVRGDEVLIEGESRRVSSWEGGARDEFSDRIKSVVEQRKGAVLLESGDEIGGGNPESLSGVALVIRHAARAAAVKRDDLNALELKAITNMP